MGLTPAGSTECFIDVDGHRVRVLRSATNRAGGAQHAPLLLIHGGGMDNAAISWYEVFDPLGEDRDVIAVDLPGFGGSEPVDSISGAPELADFVARVATRLGVTGAVCVGVSMGGDVVLNLALRHPELVKALVAIAPGGLIPLFRNRFLHFAAWAGTRLPERLLVPLTRLANRHVERALKAVVNDPAALPREVVDEFVAEAGKPRAGLAYGRYNKASIGPFSMRNNLLPVVDRITAPALFLHGENDPIVDPRGSQRASEIMPVARLVMIPDCGHWVQLEDRDRFLLEVRRFLECRG